MEMDEKTPIKDTLTTRGDMVIIDAPGDANNGQAVRMAVALSTITMTPVRILKIRALEKTPGKNA